MLFPCITWFSSTQDVRLNVHYLGLFFNQYHFYEKTLLKHFKTVFTMLQITPYVLIIIVRFINSSALVFLCSTITLLVLQGKMPAEEHGVVLSIVLWSQFPRHSLGNSSDQLSAWCVLMDVYAQCQYIFLVHSQGTVCCLIGSRVEYWRCFVMYELPAAGPAVSSQPSPNRPDPIQSSVRLCVMQFTNCVMC